MARKRILPRYVKWRDGRPRWELGGMGGKQLREAGFRSIDLKDPDGSWLSFERAGEAGKRLNAAVDTWRAFPGPLSQTDLEDLVTGLPPLERRFAGDFSYLQRGPRAHHTPRLVAELIDAHRKSVHWRTGISAGSRKVYTARGNVLKAWLGDIPVADIRPSEAGRWFNMLLDAGFARDQAPAGSKGHGLAWHEAVRDMNRPAQAALRDRRLDAMEADPDIAARPPGYTSAFYVVGYARDLVSWANRTLDLGLDNPFAKLGLSSPEGRIRYAEAAEIAHMVATADRMGKPEVGDAAAIALGTVQRRGDLLGFTWRIRREGRFMITQEKTGQVINCQIAKSTLSRLEMAWARATASGTLPGPDAKILSYATPDTLTADWKRVREEAARSMPSVADLLLHDLRDTGFTRLIESGADLLFACQVSGHSIKQATTIEKGYLAKRPAMADAAIGKLDIWMEKGGIAL